MPKTNFIQEQKEVVSAMIGLYCARRHRPAGPGLCRACQGLEAYAHTRLDACPFGPDKAFCSTCSVHCYQPIERAMIRRVMAFAGPRMLFHRPGMALAHLGSSLKHKWAHSCLPKADRL